MPNQHEWHTARLEVAAARLRLARRLGQLDYADRWEDLAVLRAAATPRPVGRVLAVALAQTI